jgi:hypothetical protein
MINGFKKPMIEETDEGLLRIADVRVKLTPIERTILGDLCERKELTSSEAIGHLLCMYELNFGNRGAVPEWEPFKEIPQPEQPTGKQRKRGGY